MDLSYLRDIMLIIWAGVATVAIIFIAVILFLYYRRTVSLLDSTELMVARVSDVADYINCELVEPVSQFGTMVRGIIKGISILGNIFKKKERKHE
jgi:hypothetical protein